MSKILVIEDDPVSLELLKNRLTKEGYEILIARTGKEGLELAAKERPDLILMDMILPGMHGLEVTIRLRENPETKEIPIIALSAMSSPEFISACYKDGIAAFLTKPFKFEDLFEKIEKLVGKEERIKPKILIIDKDIKLLTMLSMSLMKHSFEVAFLENGKAFLEQVQNIKPNLILLDLSSLSESELSFLENLMKSSEKEPFSLILTSEELSDEELKKQASKMDATDFLVKPFGKEELLKKIRKVFSNEG